MGKEDDFSVSYGGLVKAPKVLADLLESLAGAVYIDVNFDLQRLWVVSTYFFLCLVSFFRNLLMCLVFLFES